MILPKFFNENPINHGIDLLFSVFNCSMIIDYHFRLISIFFLLNKKYSH